MSDPLRILVMGYVIRAPIGGLSWHYLQYVLGLSALGHEVTYLEDSDDYVSCYDPDTDELGTDPTPGIEYAERVFARLDHGDGWAFHDAHGGAWLGPAASRISRTIQEADLLLNVSGSNPLRPWLLDVPVRVLVDTDPAFTQVRHLTDPGRRRFAEQHTAYVTFGVNLPAGTSQVPDDGFPWRPTRQPVVTDVWRGAPPGPPDGPWTTVMHWEPYVAREFDDVRYGLKRASFDLIEALPERCDEDLEIALGGPAPRKRIRSHGWRLRSALEVSRDPWDYRRYLWNSKGEFSVAKEAYVTTRSGWFSERSAAYLASGRPVVVQETGFGEWLPTGQGLLSFSDCDGACSAIEEISRDYTRHAAAAREVASLLEAGSVLDALLMDVYTSAPQRRSDELGVGATNGGEPSQRDDGTDPA